MNKERLKHLNKYLDAELSDEEISDGWCFCVEWDGLLINRYSDEEGKCCPRCVLSKEEIK